MAALGPFSSESRVARDRVHSGVVGKHRDGWVAVGPCTLVGCPEQL